MTLVVGVNLGAYALVAADSRETLYTNETSETTFDDTLQKVRRTPVGLASGSGITRAVFGA